jgi:hypothetical protein
VEKDDEERQADNDQNYQAQEHIGAPRMLGLAEVRAVPVPSHDSHGSIESLRNYNFPARLLKNSLAPTPPGSIRPPPVRAAHRPAEAIRRRFLFRVLVMGKLVLGKKVTGKKKERFPVWNGRRVPLFSR